MNLDHFSCPNRSCPDFRKTGKGNLGLYTRYGQKKVRLLICNTCSKTFSELKGTPFWDSRLDWNTIENIYRGLLDGQGIRATGRSLRADHRPTTSVTGNTSENGLSKNTVKRYLRIAHKYPNDIYNFLVNQGALTDDKTGRSRFDDMLKRFPHLAPQRR